MVVIAKNAYPLAGTVGLGKVMLGDAALGIMLESLLSIRLPQESEPQSILVKTDLRQEVQ